MKAKTFEVGTFRRPDRPGAYLWSCTCGESGLTNAKGEVYTTRAGAESGGRVHAAAAHLQQLPSPRVAESVERAPDRLDTLLRAHDVQEKRRGTKP